jgi:hypothetical protein
MEWYQYLASFFAGAFSANVIPHFVKGICGDKFPTPFAKPPGKGLSSPLVNMVWSLFNIIISYLLFKSGQVATGNLPTLIVFFAGIAAMGIMLSIHFLEKDKE